MDIYDRNNQVIRALEILDAQGLITIAGGSVSAKADENRFIVTPLQAADCLLHPNKLLRMDYDWLESGAYTDPGIETPLHAAVYHIKKQAGAVVHTHQPFASAVSACQLNALKLKNPHPLLGSKVTCTAYAKTGTPALVSEVSRALRDSEGNALIIENHGAICFGRDAEEAAAAAAALEEEARAFINQTYLDKSGNQKFAELAMYAYALTELTKSPIQIAYGSIKRIFNASRNRTGFILFDDEQRVKIAFDQITKKHPEEAKLYNVIFKMCPKINYMVINNSRPVIAMQYLDIPVRPMLDNFAERAGVRVIRTLDDPRDTARELRRASAVFLTNVGIICCGRTMEETQALSVVVENNCRAFLSALLFGKPRYLSNGQAADLRRRYLAQKAAIEKS